MYYFKNKLRYFSLLLLLLSSFKLLSITQDGPDWEVPSYVMNAGGSLKLIMFILFIFELIFIMIDIVRKIKLNVMALIIYICSLLFIIAVNLFGFDSFMFNLRYYSIVGSNMVSNSFKIGIPVSLIIFGYLTYCRKLRFGKHKYKEGL